MLINVSEVDTLTETDSSFNQPETGATPEVFLRLPRLRYMAVLGPPNQWAYFKVSLENSQFKVPLPQGRSQIVYFY